MLFPARFILHSFVYTCFDYFVAPLIWSLEQAIARVQHRFGGMRDEAKNRGGMWDLRNF